MPQRSRKDSPLESVVQPQQDVRRAIESDVQPAVSHAMLNAFDNAQYAMEDVRDEMDSAGIDTADISEAISSLYEARTHLRFAVSNGASSTKRDS